MKFATGIATYLHQWNMRYILWKWLEFDEMCTTTGIKHVHKWGGSGGLPLASCDQHKGHGWVQQVLCHRYKKHNWWFRWNMCTRTGMKNIHQLGLKMWPRIGMKHVYWNWDKTGVGLKLVYLIYKETTLSKNLRNRSCKRPLCFILSRISGVCRKLAYTPWTNKHFPSRPPSSSTSASSPPPPIRATSCNRSTTSTTTTTWQRHVTSQTDRTTRMDSNDNNTHRFDGMKTMWHARWRATSSRQWRRLASSLSNGFRWASHSTPSLLCSHEKQGPRCHRRCGNQ